MIHFFVLLLAVLNAYAKPFPQDQNIISTDILPVDSSDNLIEGSTDDLIVGSDDDGEASTDGLIASNDLIAADCQTDNLSSEDPDHLPDMDILRRDRSSTCAKIRPNGPPERYIPGLPQTYPQEQWTRIDESKREESNPQCFKGFKFLLTCGGAEVVSTEQNALKRKLGFQRTLYLAVLGCVAGKSRAEDLPIKKLIFVRSSTDCIDPAFVFRGSHTSGRQILLSSFSSKRKSSIQRLSELKSLH